MRVSWGSLLQELIPEHLCWICLHYSEQRVGFFEKSTLKQALKKKYKLDIPDLTLAKTTEDCLQQRQKITGLLVFINTQMEQYKMQSIWKRFVQKYITRSYAQLQEMRGYFHLYALYLDCVIGQSEFQKNGLPTVDSFQWLMSIERIINEVLSYQSWGSSLGHIVYQFFSFMFRTHQNRTKNHGQYALFRMRVQQANVTKTTNLDKTLKQLQTSYDPISKNTLDSNWEDAVTSHLWNSQDGQFVWDDSWNKNIAHQPLSHQILIGQFVPFIPRSPHIPKMAESVFEILKENFLKEWQKAHQKRNRWLFFWGTQSEIKHAQSAYDMMRLFVRLSEVVAGERTWVDFWEDVLVSADLAFRPSSRNLDGYDSLLVIYLQDVLQQISKERWEAYRRLPEIEENNRQQAIVNVLLRGTENGLLKKQILKLIRALFDARKTGDFKYFDACYLFLKEKEPLDPHLVHVLTSFNEEPQRFFTQTTGSIKKEKTQSGPFIEKKEDLVSVRPEISQTPFQAVVPVTQKGSDSTVPSQKTGLREDADKKQVPVPPPIPGSKKISPLVVHSIFTTEERSFLQKGWNCFDVAVGLYIGGDAIKIRRKWIETIIEQHDPSDRRLLGPEICQHLFGAISEGSDDQFKFSDPTLMEELVNLKNQYLIVCEAFQKDPALLVIQDAIGHPEDNRLTIDAMEVFFSKPEHQETFSVAYQDYLKLPSRIEYLNIKKAFFDFSERQDVFEAYLMGSENSYWNGAWINFGETYFSDGHTSTSIVDIVAKYMHKKIVIYELRGKNITLKYQTSPAKDTEETIHIQYHQGHFIHLNLSGMRPFSAH